jgi:LPS export ABC transporter permease LptG
MRILSRHVLREFLVPVTYCLVTFTMIHVLFEIFDKFDRLTETRPPLTVVLRYFVGYVAPHVEWLLPAALMLGALYATWQLSRHSEIIAMKASGIGFGTIVRPMIAASVVCALLSAANSEFLAPRVSRTSQRLAESRFQPLPPDLRTDVPYKNHAAHRVWRIDRFDADRPDRLDGVRVTHQSTSGDPERVVSCRHAEYLDGDWWFFNPAVARYDAIGNLLAPRVSTGAVERARSVVCMADYDEQPQDFLLESNMLRTKAMKIGESLSLRDLRRYLAARPNLPPRVRLERWCDIQYRLAAPWACVVITFFAVPAGVASGRQSVFKGVLLAVCLFLGFYAVTQASLALGKRAVLPAPLSAWLPNLLFLGAGLAMFLRQRR